MDPVPKSAENASVKNNKATDPNSAQPVGSRLAQFILETEYATLPKQVIHEGKRSLVNFIAAALGTSGYPEIDVTVKTLAPYAPPGQCSIIGRSERMDPLNAAFVNAVSANLLDFDDTHLDTVIHPSAPVAPAALALAEMHHADGRTLLNAFALGAEIECRLGNAVSPGHYARGWHITATCGVFGAAAAAGKLLGLSHTQLWHALGIAASQSAGLVENLPSAAKNVAVGNSSRNGLLAALFAKQGFEAAPAAIEGPLGWARACGDEPKLDAIVGELGKRWELCKNTYKPYPCGIVMHSLIDACLSLRRDHDINPDQVESTLVEGDALLLARGDREVRNERDARVSIHHCVASVLLWGAAGVREFSAECVHDPAAVALRSRVRAQLDPSLPVGAARASILLRSGHCHSCTIEHARGSIQQPLSDASLEEKFRSLVGKDTWPVDSLLDHLWRLDAIDDTRDLAKLISHAPR